MPRLYWEPKDLTVAARTGHQMFIAITGRPIDPPFAGYLRNELNRRVNVGGWPNWMRDRVSWTSVCSLRCTAMTS